MMRKMSNVSRLVVLLRVLNAGTSTLTYLISQCTQ